MLLMVSESNRMGCAHANDPSTIPRALVTMVIQLHSSKINFFDFKSLGLLSGSDSMVELNESSKCTRDGNLRRKKLAKLCRADN